MTATLPATRPSLLLLGPLLAGDQGAETPIRSARQRILLTLLAVVAADQHAVSAEELVRGIYPGEDGTKSRRALSTELWRCRQLLGTDAIISGPDGYRLDTDGVFIDVIAYLDHIQEGRRALQNANHASAAHHLEQARTLWRGSPLPDGGEHRSARVLQARLDELRVGASEDHAEALIGLGHHQQAVEILTRITSEHPHREHASSLLITAYLAAGDHRRASTALDTARRALAEYGLELGAELARARDRLTRAAGPTSHQPKPSTDTALVGRDQELAALVQLGSAALQGFTAGAALVTGEAGSGKTALIEHAAAIIATADGRSTAIARVICDQRLALPYAALTPVLERLRTHAHSAVRNSDAPAAATPESLVEEAADVIEAAADSLGGLILIVEDLHWASTEVLEVLLALLTRRAPVSLCVLATVRDPAVLRDGVAVLIAELRRRCGEVVKLLGLTEEQCALMLGPGMTPEQVADAHRLTGGNPLYLRQLARPGSGWRLTLEETLDDHLDSLTEPMGRLLEVAAVIGPEFDTRVLTTAVAQPPPLFGPKEVEEILTATDRAGLTEPSGAEHEHRFIHGLLRDRLLQRPSSMDQARTHTRVAYAIARLAPIVGGRTISTEMLAHHSIEGWPACPTEEVVTRLVAAGQEATLQLSFAAARTYYDRALELMAKDPTYDDPGTVGSLLAASGQAAVAAADLDAARATYATLRAHGERGDLVSSRLQGSLGELQTYTENRIDVRVLDDLEAGLRASLEVPADQAPAILPDALAALQTYRPAQARQLSSAFVERHPSYESSVLTRVWDREDAANKVLIADRLSQLPDVSTLLGQVRQHAAGVAAGQRSFSDLQIGWSAADCPESDRWEALMWQCTIAVATGHFARADRLIEVALGQVTRAQSALEVSERMAAVVVLRACLALYRADYATVLEILSERPATWNLKRPMSRVIGASVAVARGTPEEGWTLCEELVDEVIDGVAPGGHDVAALVAIGAGCINAGHQRGISLCRELLAPNTGLHVLHYVTAYWGSVDYQLALLTAADGDLDGALMLLANALERHRQVDAKVHEALTLRAMAAMRYHRNRGDDRTEALRLHSIAAERGAQMGMAQLSDAAWPPRSPLDIGGAYRAPAPPH